METKKKGNAVSRLRRVAVVVVVVVLLSFSRFAPALVLTLLLA